MDEGRRRHYGAFYGLEELPGEGRARGSRGPAGREARGSGGPAGCGVESGTRPRLAVYGNCQAEALRVSIDTAGVVDSVRMPPVHELTEEDLPHLERLLGWVDVLVAQAISDGYRGLPLGTAEVSARLREDTRVVAAPNYFSTVLYPEQVLVRHEDPAVVDPPVVPYHDVRRLGQAAGWTGPWEVPADAVRAGAAASLAELERREQEQGSLVISDVVRSAGAAAGWTVDHPGNPVLLALAQRVVDEVCGAGAGVGQGADAGADAGRGTAQGVGADAGRGTAQGVGADAGWGTAQVHDPGRILLSAVLTPLRPEVLAALGLEGEAREGWVVGGSRMSDEEVGAAHLEFYAKNPRVVEVGIDKKGEILRSLGWRP